MSPRYNFSLAYHTHLGKSCPHRITTPNKFSVSGFATACGRPQIYFTTRSLTVCVTCVCRNARKHNLDLNHTTSAFLKATCGTRQSTRFVGWRYCLAKSQNLHRQNDRMTLVQCQNRVCNSRILLAISKNPFYYLSFQQVQPTVYATCAGEGRQSVQTG